MPLILLDTQALIWSQAAPKRLGRSTRRVLEKAYKDATLCLSAVTFWEVARLVAEQNLHITPEPRAWRERILQLGFAEIALDGNIAIRAAELLPEHGDPFDRLILATAVCSDAILVTADERLLAWPGALRRQDARD